MSEDQKKPLVDKVKKFDEEFSAEINIGLDYNANLNQSAKEEIDKVKEFYESRL